MTIKIGDALPAVTLKKLGENGIEDIDTANYFKDKKALIFGVPGAFTPTCSEQHLPGFVESAQAIKEKGIDEIICIAVNDPFVMKHWGLAAGVDNKVTMLPDGNGDFTKATGLGFDGSGFGLNFRCKRFSMIVEDGVVKDLQVENSPGELDVAAAGACLRRLN